MNVIFGWLPRELIEQEERYTNNNYQGSRRQRDGYHGMWELANMPTNHEAFDEDMLACLAGALVRPKCNLQFTPPLVRSAMR